MAESNGPPVKARQGLLARSSRNILSVTLVVLHFFFLSFTSNTIGKIIPMDFLNIKNCFSIDTIIILPSIVVFIRVFHAKMNNLIILL